MVLKLDDTYLPIKLELPAATPGELGIEDRPFKHVCRLAYGDALKAENRVDGHVPVFGSNGIVGTHTEANTHGPCIVVGRKGSFGKITYSPDPGFVIDTAYFIDDRTSSESLHWLRYVLSVAGLDSVSKDSAVPGLSRPDAYSRTLPWAPIEYQNSIAHFLRWYDAKVNRLIRNKRRLIALLNEQKRIVIQQAVTRGIEPTGPMKDSGLAWIGEIPAHWEIRRIKDEFANLNRRRVPLSSTQRGEMVTREYDYYGASGVIDKVDDYLFHEDLLLIAEDGANLVLRGKPLAIIARGRYWVNNHAHILKPRSGSLEFFAHALERIDFRPWITGAAQPKLTADRLMAIPVAVPPVFEQHRIVAWIEAETRTLSETAKTAAREIDLIREYRNRLVADVVTGQLDVRAAAANLPDLDPLDAATEPDATDLDMNLDEDGTGLDELPDEDADAAD